MAAKSISNDRCRSSASAYNSEFEETSRGRQYSNFGRSHLNCKRHYEYQKPRFQKRYQSFPRQLYYRELEVCKLDAVSANDEDYNSIICSSKKTNAGLDWFILSGHFYNSTSLEKPSTVSTLITDAFKSEWGVVCNGVSSSGLWSKTSHNQNIEWKLHPTVLLGRVPRKLKLEEVSDALIIAPCLPTAHWYPQLPELLVQRPALLPQCETPTLASGRRSTSSRGNDTTNCVACNRDSLEVRGISQRAANYVLKPW
ncbi:unnamed protein product [Porites lobata]|uniref:Uncharacterized protein n=1 Tax=Porites lobata TaxID=104759 RepID=A0ABN8N687_9CNID|nr:unnamed protein product [Porites lobata]